MGPCCEQHAVKHTLDSLQKVGQFPWTACYLAHLRGGESGSHSGGISTQSCLQMSESSGQHPALSYLEIAWQCKLSRHNPDSAETTLVKSANINGPHSSLLSLLVSNLAFRPLVTSWPKIKVSYVTSLILSRPISLPLFTILILIIGTLLIALTFLLHILPFECDLILHLSQGPSSTNWPQAAIVPSYCPPSVTEGFGPTWMLANKLEQGQRWLPITSPTGDWSLAAPLAQKTGATQR